jgi:hypothetical protein
MVVAVSIHLRSHSHDHRNNEPPPPAEPLLAHDRRAPEELVLAQPRRALKVVRGRGLPEPGRVVAHKPGGSGRTGGSGWVAVAGMDWSCRSGHFEWWKVRNEALLSESALMAVRKKK